MKNKYYIFRNIFLFFLITGNVSLFAQARLTGLITDAYGNPIPGVLIYVESNTNGALTDETGKFTISDETNPALLISYPGFHTRQVTDFSDGMTIVLDRDVSSRDKNIPLLFDNRPDYSVTSATTTISGDELRKSHSYNLSAALVGRIPGLIVRQTGFTPGEESFGFNIRGDHSTNGNSPLILVDGVVSQNISYISINDVESVTVLKDAAAVNLYGLKGGAGIISITTKRGTFGTPKINVEANYTLQHAKAPDMLHSWEYAALRNQAYINDGNENGRPYTDAQIENLRSGTNRELYPDNNWYDMFVKPVVHTEQVNVSASGGTKVVKYYSNIGYIHQGDPFKVKQNDYDADRYFNRYNFRTNMDVQVHKYIKASANLSGYVQRTNGSRSSKADIMSSMFTLDPTIAGPLTPDGEVVASISETDPPYGRINRNGYLRNVTTNVNAIIGLDVDLSFILPGLSTSATGMFDAKSWSNISGNTNYERWVRDETKPNELAYIKNGSQLNDPLSLSKGVSYDYRSDFTWLLQYRKRIDDHSFGIFGLIRYQYENIADESILGILPYISMTYGGSLHYGYKNVLFADFTANYSGSEQFSKDNRYAFFPVGSMAWVASNHDFMKDNPVLSYLKLRASYGQVGSDQLFGIRYLYLDNITKGGGNFISEYDGGIMELQRGNKDLKSEKSTIANIGVEVGLFNKFTFKAELFRDDRQDILLARQSIPLTQGLPLLSLATANMGQVINKGIELQLGYNNSFSKDFSLGADSYFTFSKNTVENYDEVERSSDYAYRYQMEGYGLHQQWGYLVDKSNGNGYFNSEAEIAQSGLTYEGRAPRPGDLRYKDLNGDHIINDKDLAPIGYTVLPRINYGINLTAKWKQFDISVFMQGVAQSSGFYSGYGFDETYKGGSYAPIHKEAWTPERYAAGEKISAPALSNSTSSSHLNNNFFLKNKSYFRLKNLEIGYNLPLHASNKVFSKGIRIYLSVMNLFTIDKLDYDGLDPEMSRLDAFSAYRYYNVGLNLTF